MMNLTADDFRTVLHDLLEEAEQLGFVAVDINSGNLHRRVGGYPSQNHRMPVCCEVMYAEMKSIDTIVSQPNSSTGASVRVRYVLPR
jgi:5-methylcytosine-specific restriction protein A